MATGGQYTVRCAKCDLTRPVGSSGCLGQGELKGEKGSPHSLLGYRECGDGASYEKGEEGGCHSGNAAEAVQDPRGAPRRIRDARGWRGLGPLSGRTAQGRICSPGLCVRPLTEIILPDFQTPPLLHLRNNLVDPSHSTKQLTNQ